MSVRTKAYLIGGGVGSLAAAAFMIRDGQLEGENITILEALGVVGGSLDGAGDAAAGYAMRGGRMFTTDNYECTWELFRDIPSLGDPGISVYDETVAFNERYPSHSLARLVDANGAKVPAQSMGFSMSHRLELLKLYEAEEATLGTTRINEWLTPSFFVTNFWFMWSTTFAFQPWHSAVEFRRYLHRFLLEFSRINTLAGVKRTVYNQYDSLVRPLQRWLEGKGVRFQTDYRVIGINQETCDGCLVATALRCVTHSGSALIGVGEGDFVLLQNGSMTDASSLGSMTAAPAKLTRTDSISWTLWEELADGRPRFGKPSAFNRCIAQSCWESFTVTLSTPEFFDQMRGLTGNEAGTGGLVTFKDSHWLLSIVLAHQPHFLNQPAGVCIFWGYALFPDRVGNFVPKAMADCTGREILTELSGHLHMDSDVFTSGNCIPCRMPYITSMFMPRAPGDRPLPVPVGSGNLAFISQFVEIPGDVVFTVEYSIRAAQLAVYELLGITRKVPAVTPHDASHSAQLAALIKAFE